MMHNNQSSSPIADTLSRKRSRSHSRSPSCSCSCSRYRSRFCSSSSGSSYTNHHVAHDDCRSNGSLKHEYLYSEDNNDGHYHRPKKSDTVFSIFAMTICTYVGKMGDHILQWAICTLIQNLINISHRGIQLLSTSTYLPLAKVGRL